MSQRGGRPIDFQAWAQNQIVKRAVAALEARDEAFAERNADTPLPQLARYLSRCAISLGHSPSPSEVDGGTFIEQRFGSWAAAMAAARLPQPRSMRKLRAAFRAYRIQRGQHRCVRGSRLWRGSRRELTAVRHTVRQDLQFLCIARPCALHQDMSLHILIIPLFHIVTQNS